MINSILIAPSAGWADDAGAWTPGARFGHMCEAELSHAVANELGEELDTARLRWSALPTARHPGLSPLARLERVEPGMLLVAVAFPLSGAPSRTSGTVHFGTKAGEDLAEMMAEALGLWGKAYWSGYEARRPRQTIEPILTVPDTVAVVLEPFALEQTGAAALATRLRPLAQSLRWGLEEYLRSRQHAVARHGIYRGRCYG